MAELGLRIVDHCLDCPFSFLPAMSLKVTCVRQIDKEAIGFSQLGKLFKTCPLKKAPILVQLRNT